MSCPCDSLLFSIAKASATLPFLTEAPASKVHQPLCFPKLSSHLHSHNTYGSAKWCWSRTVSRNPPFSPPASLPWDVAPALHRTAQHNSIPNPNNYSMYIPVTAHGCPFPMPTISRVPFHKHNILRTCTRPACVSLLRTQALSHISFCLLIAGQ